MNICLFSKEEINQPLSIKDERGQHLIKVLHKKVGDSFTAGIIGGQSGQATIISIESNLISFDFKADGEGKPLTCLRMIIGFPRPIQLKRLLRDIAALGVSQVHLTGTELGEKSYMQSNLVERGSAYKMLLDGSVQAGSTHIPQLFLHKTLKECLDACQEQAAIKLALDNVNPKASLQKALDQACTNEAFDKENPLYAAIGSERGWTDKERKMLEEYGFITCGMGPRIMRTETAATVAGSIILNKLGYLN
ncbi:MAG: 16S rRNA (uracil(1498)-N(3))-methyltransferase [Treponema sp.]|nr:16S rRNA (uracil(1498)-N(3))-methyltransferase [Treponema sp.]